MKIRKLSHYIKEYGLQAAAIRAADRLLNRRAVEVSYAAWLQRNRKSSRDYGRMAKARFAWNPLIGVRAVMDPEDRTAFMQSLNLQIYRNFKPYKNCPGADYILLAGSGCILSPDLLWEAVSLLNVELLDRVHMKEAPVVIYFDSDRLGQDGHKVDPSFRPEYDEDLLESVNYMGQVVLVRADAAREAGLESGGAQDLHSFLRKVCSLAPVQPGSERTGAVRHIARVLYHELDEAEESMLTGVEAVDGEQELVTVMIPNKDHVEDLRKCVESLQTVNTWQNLEILILENNSEDPGTFAFYEEIQEKDSRIRVLQYDKPFNYAAVNNFGAASANGKYLLLLNNDTQILKPDSIGQLVSLVRRDKTGAAGALLYYPDRTIQHAGIILGYGGIAGHAFAGERSGYELGSFPGLVYTHTHNVCAVTGACLMVRTSVYLKIGGMDEQLAVTFNDVDLCMRLRKSGLKVLMCPKAQLYHNESVSRGEEDTPEKVARFHQEIRIFASRWENELRDSDPFYNPNLTLTGRSWTCRDELREPVKPYLQYLYPED